MYAVQYSLDRFYVLFYSRTFIYYFLLFSDYHFSSILKFKYIRNTLLDTIAHKHTLWLFIVLSVLNLNSIFLGTRLRLQTGTATPLRQLIEVMMITHDMANEIMGAILKYCQRRAW